MIEYIKIIIVLVDAVPKTFFFIGVVVGALSTGIYYENKMLAHIKELRVEIRKELTELE